MKKMILVVLASTFLAACGESHTYRGMMTGDSAIRTETEVSITITRTSETEATVEVKGSGDTMLEKCMYPIKLSSEGGGSWNPDTCYLKTEFGSDSRMVTGLIEIKDKMMTWNPALYNVTDHSTVRYEFMGREK